MRSSLRLHVSNPPPAYMTCPAQIGHLIGLRYCCGAALNAAIRLRRDVEGYPLFNRSNSDDKYESEPLSQIFMSLTRIGLCA